MNLPRGKPPSIVPKTNAVAPVPSSETKPVNQPTSSMQPTPVIEPTSSIQPTLFNEPKPANQPTPVNQPTLVNQPTPVNQPIPVNQATSSIPPIPVSQFSVTEPTPEQSPDRDQDQQSIAPPPGFQVKAWDEHCFYLPFFLSALID